MNTIEIIDSDNQNIILRVDKITSIRKIEETNGKQYCGILMDNQVEFKTYVTFDSLKSLLWGRGWGTR